jgi:hypothetical protein
MTSGGADLMATDEDGVEVQKKYFNRFRVMSEEGASLAGQEHGMDRADICSFEASTVLPARSSYAASRVDSTRRRHF